MESELTRQFLTALFKGAAVTVEITLMACILALFMAFAAGLAKLYGGRIVKAFSIAYIEVFRGTSALVQLFWIFFALPFFGISLSPVTAAVAALGLNVGAYGAEVVRGAILATPKDQWEATIALNMPRGLALRRVVIPQAFVRMIPPFGNLFIELLKATALVSLITLKDLTFQGQLLRAATMRTVEIYTLVLIIYFCLAQVITAFMRRVERRATRGLDYGGVRS